MCVCVGVNMYAQHTRHPTQIQKSHKEGAFYMCAYMPPMCTCFYARQGILARTFLICDPRIRARGCGQANARVRHSRTGAVEAALRKALAAASCVRACEGASVSACVYTITSSGCAEKRNVGPHMWCVSECAHGVGPHVWCVSDRTHERETRLFQHSLAYRAAIFFLRNA